jgi:hypothetical protein
MNRVIHIASRLLLVDPHWDDSCTDAMAVDDDEEEEVDDDWGLEPDSQGEDDSGDISWKVRISAAKVLRCAISSRSAALHQHFVPLLQLFSSRFAEREVAVQTVTISCCFY